MMRHKKKLLNSKLVAAFGVVFLLLAGRAEAGRLGNNLARTLCANSVESAVFVHYTGLAKYKRIANMKGTFKYTLWGSPSVATFSKRGKRARCKVETRHANGGAPQRRCFYVGVQYDRLFKYEAPLDQCGYQVAQKYRKHYR
ncbi:MAG: hypothetical protein HQL53_07265 [Magnetococcales bacterium]|nr:hypothetical protein [Magnetococcales bacterium]